MAASLLAIPFRNTDKSGEPERIARSVGATIEAFDQAGHERGRSHGRWRELGWREEYGSVELQPAKITIAPDGADHWLDVLVRIYFHRNEGPNDSYGCYLVREPKNLTWMRLQTAALGPGSYRLRVRVTGDNLKPQMFEYEVHVQDRTEDPSLAAAPIVTPI